MEQKDVASLLNWGDVASKAFKVEVAFEYRLGLVAFKVEIKGNVYNFL